VSHCDADAAEQLDSFGDLVDELVLLLVVLVEEQMQLIKRRPCHLPVVLLVQVAQRDRIGKQLVEIVHAFLAHLLRRLIPPCTTAHRAPNQALTLSREFTKGGVSDGKMSTRSRSGDANVWSRPSRSGRTL
jgi:hypothetical protein